MKSGSIVAVELDYESDWQDAVALCDYVLGGHLMADVDTDWFEQFVLASAFS